MCVQNYLLQVVAGVWCRSFRCAAVAGEALADGVVDQLLLVLNRGASLTLGDNVLQTFANVLSTCRAFIGHQLLAHEDSAVLFFIPTYLADVLLRTAR